MQISNNEAFQLYRYTLVNNFFFFFKEAWHILEPSTELSLNWHHKYICDILQSETFRIGERKPKTKDIIINVPFRSTKSIIVSQMWNAWAWLKYPQLRFITSSYASRLSIRDAKKTRDIINSNWYQGLFGDLYQWTSDQNVKSEYENDKTGKRFVTSTESSLTGEGGDILIWDDANNPKDTSEVKLQSTIDWHDDVFYSRLNNHKIGIRVGIQQRTHEDDLTGHIINKFGEEINHVVIPIELSDNIQPTELKKYYKNGLFWEWKFDRKEIDNYRKILSKTAFSGQLEQRPAPQEGNIIKEAWFNIIKKSELPFNPDVVRKEWHIDGAYTKDTKNDPTAIMLSVFYHGNLYILSSTTKHLELYELLKFFPKHAEANGYTFRDTVNIEPKASGKSLRSMLNKEKYNCIEIPNRWVSLGKINRAEDCSPTIESGKIYLVEAPWNESFINECCVFPNGKHDDQLDNLCYAIYKSYMQRKVILK